MLIVMYWSMWGSEVSFLRLMPLLLLVGSYNWHFPCMINDTPFMVYLFHLTSSATNSMCLRISNLI